MKDATPEDRFGRRVRIEREARGWTQADLAEKLKDRGVVLHPSAIAKIELRDSDRPRAIRLDEAQAIAEVLGVNLFNLIDDEDRRIRLHASHLYLFLTNLMELLEDEGRSVEDGLMDLVLSVEPDQRGKLTSMLVMREFSDLLEEAINGTGRLIALLRHPSRMALAGSGDDGDDSAS